MVIDLYHGSVDIIQQPVYGKGKLTNDYGRGFYCTENVELAKEWACGHNTDGVANHYRLDMEGLSILNLNSPEYTVMNWLAILAKNRTYWQNGSISSEAKQYLQEHFYIDTKKYDIVIGYRADDSYFSFAQGFVANTISYRKLSMAMRLGKLGEQVMLQSEKAFSALNFIDAIPAEATDYFMKKDARDREARREYRKQQTQSDSVDDIYMIDIIRGGIQNDDTRLR